LQRLGNRAAITQLIALEEAVSVVPFDLMEIQDAMELVRSTPQWQGTLQDASIVVLTRILDCPIETLLGLAIWNSGRLPLGRMIEF